MHWKLVSSLIIKIIVVITFTISKRLFLMIINFNQLAKEDYKLRYDEKEKEVHHLNEKVLFMKDSLVFMVFISNLDSETFSLKLFLFPIFVDRTIVKFG